MRLMSWTSLLFSLAGVAVSAQTLNLSLTTYTTPVPTNTYSFSHLVVGDFNGDTRPDTALLAAPAGAPGTASDIIVQLSNADGTLQTGKVTTAGMNVRAIAAGDFNGDGKLDLVLANFYDVSVSVLLGKGDGTFQPGTTVKVDGGTYTSAWFVAVGDFNKDGKLDVAVAMEAPPSASDGVGILFGKGDGTFNKVSYFATGLNPRWIGVADLNGDGRLDLVVTNTHSNTVSVLLGDADVTFKPQIAPAAGTRPGFGAIGDFNGDGHPDLAIVASSIATLTVLLGHGDGTFPTLQSYPLTTSPAWVEAVDLDGDGILDLAVSTGSPALTMLVFSGKGDGTFQPLVSFAAGPGLGGGTIAAADFNGDGKRELAVGNGPTASPASAVAVSIMTSGPPVATTRTISHIANGDAWRTTVILINTGSQADAFDLKFWDEHGSPLLLDFGTDGITADLTGMLQPGVARFFRTAGTGNLKAGWAELTALQAIDGNSIFGLQSPGKGDSEAAVPLSPGGGTELYLPFDYTKGFSTGVAFADPSQLAATVSASILDDTDAVIPSANTFQVPARGHFSDVLASQSLYPAVVSKRGVAHFTSNTNIFALGIRANGKAFTSIDALSGVTAATKTIPHIANGGGWKTTFLIVSTAALAANFTMKFWDEAGAALTLPLAGADGTVSSITGAIQPSELRVVQTTGAGSTLVTGWAELSGLTGAIGGTAIFAFQSPGQSDSEAAVPFTTVSSTQLFMPYDYTPGYSTAIAFTNAGATAATVTATFTDDAGHNLGSGPPITVPAHGHASAILGGLRPSIAGTRGTVSLTSNVPVFGLGIRANGAAFTSLKVIAK